MTAEKLAAKLAAEHGTRNPFAICLQLDVPVVYHPLAGTGLRGYYLKRQGVPIITIAREQPEMAANFVCAHELGHHLRHGHLNRVFMDSFTYLEPDRYEDEADTFAAQLLFGAPPLYQDITLTQQQMAIVLNVPPHQVDARLLTLGVFH